MISRIEYRRLHEVFGANVDELVRRLGNYILDVTAIEMPNDSGQAGELPSENEARSCLVFGAENARHYGTI
jgi:hypothetical protein